ncbi:MAG: hypothetical protein D6782_05095, partial [Alphaproteobacteria bacterium]
MTKDDRAMAEQSPAARTSLQWAVAALAVAGLVAVGYWLVRPARQAQEPAPAPVAEAPVQEAPVAEAVASEQDLPSFDIVRLSRGGTGVI